MRIIELKKKESELLSECFGQGVADASDGKLFVKPSEMKIDPNKRSLIIGLGGSGIKTVNLVKTVLRAKCTDFGGRVSFLAIDTDANDILRSTTALAPGETHVISNEGGDINSFYRNARRNSFIDSWCTPRVPAMQDLTLDGANQKRQISKMKIFYPSDLACPNDMKLMAAMKNAVNRAMKDAMADEKLQVFLVLGISGGTGSGGIIDIAQLVRRVAPVGSQLIGVFYLPDAMPIYDNSIMANGYAALKELDYYICARQREDEDKLFVSPASDGERPVDIRKGKPLYDMPILVSGSADGIGNEMEKYRETRKTATEFIVNLLADSENTKSNAAGDDQFLIKSFFSNKETVRTATFLPNMYDSHSSHENPGTFGEDCFDYCAIGVSTIAMPERIIMSYAVDEIVETLLGNESMFAGNGFKGFDLKPMGRVQADSAIPAILINGRAVDSRIVEICRLSKPNNTEFSIDEIRSGNAAVQYRNALGLNKFRAKAFQESEVWLTGQARAFEERAKMYMLEHGPHSFVCLCKGIGPDGETFDGLLARLEKMEDPVDRAEKIRASKAKTDRLQSKMNGFLGKISNWLGHHVDTWHSQFLELESARIEEAVAEHLYGESDHAFDTYFRDPVIRFIEACEDFDVALEELRKVYRDLGDGFETLEKFRATAQATEPINVNILNGMSEYSWARALVDQSIRAVNFQTLKENLIQDFMDNQRSWTNYDPKRPLNSPRRQFDALIADSGFAMQTLTLEMYFNQCVADPAAEAERMVEQLINRARPRYHQLGSALGREAKTYLLAPAQLFSGNPALKESFDAACKHHDVEIYLSHVEDKMVCYRFKCALPIYALAEIQRWESAYEALNPEMDVLLHTNTGKDEDFSKDKGVPWADRPPVSYRSDVRLPGSSGQVSREGRYFNQVIDPFFRQALEIGLILPVAEGAAPNETYTFECLILDQKGWDYSFSVSEYSSRNGTVKNGILQKGKPLAEYFAQKNGVGAASCLRKIELLDAGRFNNPMPRAIAEDRARRILRKNTPLFIHLKRSLPVLQAVSDAIDEVNKASLSAQMIPTFAKAIAFGILREDEKHFWKVHLGGKPTPLCRLVGASYENGSNAVLFEKGFRVKLLFDAFIEAPDTHTDVSDAVNEIWQPLVNNDAHVLQDFLDVLQWAKDEADARMDEYFADGRVMARRSFFREMHLEDEADEMAEQIKALYQGVQRTYKNLQELK
ncbi:MAG: tubulin-like doman-containing protein [Eubacteriales bacterium]|nr:tubulin-like doman-containing protein [Eubacteriales bacterium]